MTDTIIKVNDIWKQYRLGSIDSGTLKEDIHRWWGSRLGKTDRQKEQRNPWFWSLREVSFEVKQGEVLGIIGENGAGKSTLLKILSRVTRPTRGDIRGRGRMASLLEVGTGFHEELTGRENIFLNGNILGMTNREIKARFEEIVEFSGVARFIDTPVKRYSSGMYLRLAFAVAAHLDPEILVVDEVLAVGDQEFQQRCLEKMREAAGKQGCTILYVSHHLRSVERLCHRVLLLQEGRVTDEGLPRSVIRHYLGLSTQQVWSQQWTDDEAPGNDVIRVKATALLPEPSAAKEMDIRTPLEVRFGFLNREAGINLCVGVHLFTAAGDCVFDVSSQPAILEAGHFEGSCNIPGNFLNDGDYYISVIFVRDTVEQLFYLEKCLSFSLADYRGDIRWQGKWMGFVRPGLPVIITPKDHCSPLL